MYSLLYLYKHIIIKCLIVDKSYINKVCFSKIILVYILYEK